VLIYNFDTVILSLYRAILCVQNNLFVKVPRPGNSEVIFSVFESSCHLLRLSNYSR